MIRPFLVMVMLALVAAGAGFLLARHLNPASPRVESLSIDTLAEARVVEDLIGQVRPDFTHQDIDGRPVSAADFEGRIMLLNFWATWCKPCVDEMPMLSELQAAHNAGELAVIGIALDKPGRARDFARKLQIDYTILLGQADVILTGRRYGNDTGLLPFSVLVDANGIIRWARLGVLERRELELELEKLQ